MSDATKAYNYLCENVPKWLESIETIRTRMSEKQDFASKVAVPATPVIKKTGSNETIRDERNNNNQINGVTIEVTSAPQPQADVSMRAASTQHHQAAYLAKRKRKTASLLSGHYSGPSKYRSRALVIVYYDSDVQKSFETLVRNLGAGRNFIRKGKMAARIESLGDFGQDSSEDDGDYDPVMAKIGYRPKVGLQPYRTARTRSDFGAITPSAGPDQFDSTDKALEKAQSLCERGAHQFLRDGDCEAELDGCKEQLLEVMKLAEPEAKKYRAKDEQQKLRQQAREEREKRMSQQQQNTQRDSPHILDGNGLLEVDDEVDDDDEELTLAALAPIRMRSRMAARV